MSDALPMRIFRAEVESVDRLNPAMVRVTFGGPGLDGFTSTDVGDEFVRAFFPDPGQREPRMPVVSGRGWEFPPGVEPSTLRNYTIRSVDPARGRMAIDFVVHDGGVAASWAMRARPGDAIAVNTPSGLYDAPDDITWQLLMADATGLPAVGRLLEQVPDGVATDVVLEVASPAHQVGLSVGSDVNLTWVRGGNGHGPSRLEKILRQRELPSGTGYVWVAGETRTLRAVRRYLRHELALPATAYKVVGYWTEGAERWRARYEALDEQVRARLSEMWESDRDEEEIEDEYVRELEALGL